MEDLKIEEVDLSTRMIEATTESRIIIVPSELSFAYWDTYYIINLVQEHLDLLCKFDVIHNMRSQDSFIVLDINLNRGELNLHPVLRTPDLDFYKFTINQGDKFMIMNSVSSQSDNNV